MRNKWCILDIDFSALARETNRKNRNDKFKRAHERDLPDKPHGVEIAKGVYDCGDYIYVGDKD